MVHRAFDRRQCHQLKVTYVSRAHTHTHTHIYTHIYIHIYIYIYMEIEKFGQGE